MSHDVVAEYTPPESGLTDSHERMTRSEIAKRIAALKGISYVGEYDPSACPPGRTYFVPSDTLVGVERALALGIRGEQDLFGGVVPYSFVATKSITHPRIDQNALAPEGWSDAFSDLVRNAVLLGFSVFTHAQAHEAGQRLFEHGPVRVKPVRATAGHGQKVVLNGAELRAVIATFDPSELATDGLVLEEDLTDVTTYSVGQVRVGELVASYYGIQRLTTDNSGEKVYGGSELVVTRGSFEELLALDVTDEVRMAVAQARTYDDSTACYRGMFSSRRNYDVAQGKDARGRRRSGVLEQSWRIGGATGAEISALEAFKAHPCRRVVRASTFEIYGESPPPPPQATVYFRGVDERIGPFTKYSLVEEHDNAR